MSTEKRMPPVSTGMELNVPCSEVKKDLSYVEVEEQLKFLQGRILTIIDASVETEKKKAVKDLTNNEFVARFNYLYDRSHIDACRGI